MNEQTPGSDGHPAQGAARAQDPAQGAARAQDPGGRGEGEDKVADRVKDAAYAAVGLGVLGLQSLQVRRREMAKQVEPQVREAAVRLRRLASTADETVDPVLDRIEAKLPEATRDLVHTARSAATEARNTILDRAARPH